MKKKYLTIALTAFSFIAGITNVQAQDTTLSFGSYLVKTPWQVGFGASSNVDDGKKNPFNFKIRQFSSPFKMTIEKDIFKPLTPKGGPSI